MSEDMEWYIMKFDADLILDSFKPLKDMEEKRAVISFEAKRKLTKLLDLVRETEKDQLNPDELFIKQKNYQLVKNLLKKVLDCEPLDRSDMLFCNKVWKRYSGKI